jgi:hypothetical protein
VAEESPVELWVQVEASGADAEEIDRLTRGLLAELRELPVESVAIPVAGKPPTGAKAVEVAALGALVLSVLPKVLPSVIAFLQSWRKRGDGKSIKIKVLKGKRTLEVEIPAGALRQEELHKLLASLGAPQTRPSASRKRP